METVYAAFERTAQRHGARAFLPALSYRDSLAQVQAIAARYAAHGFGAGHRVALLFPSGKEFLLHFLALNSLGASIVPLNPEYREAERAYILEHSETTQVVTPDFELEKAGKPTGAGEAALLYTSGTTGKPKGCLLSNFYFLNVGRRYLDEGGLCAVREGEERLITPLPLFHMNALAVSTTAMILSAGCVIQLERFHPKSWWREVAESGATIVHYLGVMPAMLLNLPEGPHDRAHRVRFGYGANANPKDHAAFEARFGFPLIEAWAMTETGGGALVAASREPRHVGTRCFGAPREDLDIRIEADGELLVRQRGTDPRRGFFSGYYRDEAATEHAWRGGWFHTGDAVRRGDDGQLHFVDRLKNIIRRSGENIAALEVEATLANHPAVRQAAVVAAPDPVRDEEVLACVILNDAFRPDRETAASLQRHCLEQLSYFKAPGYVAFVESLPVTSTNKVQKARLADFASNPMASPRCFDLRDGKKRR
ncbi:MAG TPA: AMP-binding protein [Burkholderiales bacterium]|nr:AMP-binding protein [Burkholderiales bacterium]